MIAMLGLTDNLSALGHVRPRNEILRLTCEQMMNNS